MKTRIITMLLAVCMLICMAGCNGNPEANSSGETQSILTESDIREIVKEELEAEKLEFVPGKELICPQGESFKMKGYADIYDSLDPSFVKKSNYDVEITNFKAKMLKEGDINNIEDYCLKQVYFPYIYEIEISGKIDPKYANLPTTLDIRFNQDTGLTFYDNTEQTSPSKLNIESDGSFSLKSRVGYNSVQDTIYVSSFYSSGYRNLIK